MIEILFHMFMTIFIGAMSIAIIAGIIVLVIVLRDEIKDRKH